MNKMIKWKTKSKGEPMPNKTEGWKKSSLRSQYVLILYSLLAYYYVLMLYSILAYFYISLFINWLNHFFIWILLFTLFLLCIILPNSSYSFDSAYSFDIFYSFMQIVYSFWFCLFIWNDLFIQAFNLFIFFCLFIIVLPIHRIWFIHPINE